MEVRRSGEDVAEVRRRVRGRASAVFVKHLLVTSGVKVRLPQQHLQKRGRGRLFFLSTVIFDQSEQTYVPVVLRESGQKQWDF